MIDFKAASAFITASARPIERSVFNVLFGEGDPALVAENLETFRNADGGFGHGLEPDKLVPDSQALDVEIAFERLALVGLNGHPVLAPACDWLASVADEQGAVPVLMPNSYDHPRAGHWNSSSYPPALNPTAAIIGHAHALGATHPWVALATEYCFGMIESGAVPDEGHELLAVTKFLAHVPDRDRALAAAPAVAAAIESASFVKYAANSDAYGLTPVDFAPSAHSFARAWFPDEIIAGHLVALAADQQPDGGWPIAWEPPTPESLLAWRGIRTLSAMTALRAYDAF
jgi:hypothetical protein